LVEVLATGSVRLSFFSDSLVMIVPWLKVEGCLVLAGWGLVTA
jgi:hypothetical protein